MAYFETGKFCADDGIGLFYQFYRAEGLGRTMVILHGHGEHTGRYEKFGDHLSDSGVSLATFDMRGQGRSEGREVYVESFEVFLNDLTTFIRHLEKNHGVHDPIMLFGHSAGGIVAVHWALRNLEKVSALFLSSPCFGLRLPKIILGFNHFLNSICPGFYYRNPVYPPYLTHDPGEVEKYKNDRLIRRKITVRSLHEMVSYMARLEALESISVPFPVYVLTAGVEKVVDDRKTKLFFDKVRAPDKDLTSFPGFYHEIFNELGQEKAFDKLKEFLERSRHCLPQ